VRGAFDSRRSKPLSVNSLLTVALMTRSDKRASRRVPSRIWQPSVPASFFPS
jgi:hypothetical protein